MAIRNHTNIESQSELRSLEAMIEIRESCRDAIEIQVVAHLTAMHRANCGLPREMAWRRDRHWRRRHRRSAAICRRAACFLDLLFEFAEAAAFRSICISMSILMPPTSARRRDRAYARAWDAGTRYCGPLLRSSAAAPEEARRIVERLGGGDIAS